MTAQHLKTGWKRVKFGDVVRQVKDKVDPDIAGLDRYIAGEHMDTDDLRLRRWGDIGDGYLGPAFHMRFKPEQVLYGSRRTYLRKVAVADFEGICANTTFVLESANPNVLLPELLPFVMQTENFHDHSIKQSKGSVNPYVNFSDLAWYEFALPPLAEQRRIAEVLGAGLDLIEILSHATDSAQLCLEATREFLFAKERTESVRLGSVLTGIEAGKSLVGVNSPPDDQEYAVLKVSAVGESGFRPDESKTLVDQSQFMTQFRVKAGDLLITRANTPTLVGMSCLVDHDFPNLMLSDKTLRLKPRSDLSSRLLREALWTHNIRQQIKSLATGTGAAMKNISQSKLGELVIRLPRNTSDGSPELAMLMDARDAVVSLERRTQLATNMQHKMINDLLATVGY